MVESSYIVKGWVGFCTTLIVGGSWIMVFMCYLGCRAYHNTMADNENTKHILLNIAYEQFAVTIQVLSTLLASKVSIKFDRSKCINK